MHHTTTCRILLEQGNLATGLNTILLILKKNSGEETANNEIPQWVLK